MKKTILLIDDDKYVPDLYIKALKMNDFEVVHCRTPDDATKELDARKNWPDLIILDLSMPPTGSLAKEDTLNGLATGVVYFPTLRKKRPKTPIVVLTNVLAEEIRSRLPTGADGPSRIFHKLDYSPLDLPEQIVEVLAEQ